MECRNSWIHIHDSQLGCKLHHDRQSSSHSLSRSITASETLDSSLWDMNQLLIQQEEMMSHWLNPSSLRVKAQFSIGTLCYNHTQSAARSVSRQSSFKHFRYFTKQQLSHQICTTASRRIESHCGTL
jgi:hypothetical protein